VSVRGNLAYAWDAGDAAGRPFAAVSLTPVKAATQLQVAAAFAVNPAYTAALGDPVQRRRCGRAAHRTQRPQTQVEAHTRHGRCDPAVAGGWGVLHRTVATTVGVSLGRVPNALRPIDTCDSVNPQVRGLGGAGS
jgi:hypothetical protein